MARSRRYLIAALAAMLLAGLAIAGVAAWLRPGEEPASRALGPVLLVPGYGGSTTVLEELARRLRAEGRTATVLTLGAATGDLREQAAQLDRAVGEALRDGAATVDVIGFSAGGVVARLWAREDDGAARARRIVTLAAPHHGTRLATLATVLAPSYCPLACQQLQPGSPLLDALNGGDETPDGPEWISLWTADDQTVSPPESAQLDGALNVRVQDVCGGARVGHGQFPQAPVVIGIVLRAVGAAPVASPTAAECQTLTAMGSR